MTRVVEPVPGDGPALMVAIVVPDANAAIAFYVAAFGAEESFRFVEPSGKVRYAELLLGGTRLMLSDPYPEHGVAPPPDGARSMRLHLYVADVDAVVARALGLGAVLRQPAQDQFYGDRSATVIDLAGHAWHIASRREEVAPAEMQRRWDRVMQEPAQTARA